MKEYDSLLSDVSGNTLSSFRGIEVQYLPTCEARREVCTSIPRNDDNVFPDTSDKRLSCSHCDQGNDSQVINGVLDSRICLFVSKTM